MKRLFRKKFDVIAATAAEACARSKTAPAMVSANQRTAIWINQPKSADQGEEGETNRNDMADQLIGDQHHVFPGDASIEFALAVLPFAKLVGQFPQPQGPL